MKNRVKFPALLSLTALSTLYLLSCAEEPPTTPDGKGEIEIVALGDISLQDSVSNYVPMANAKVYISSEYGTMESYTDNNGVIKLEGLPSAVYNINVRMPHPVNPAILITGNITDISLAAEQIQQDTLLAEQIAGTGIALNEVYVTGPVSDLYYVHDKFIELYNYSDSRKYLDGMIICRFSSSNNGSGPGNDVGNDGDIDGLTYAYKFPGNPGEKNHPFEPHTFLVIASQALDHRAYVPKSIDLSKADWEFYNQFSTVEFDNPNIPNLENINLARPYDFLLGMAGDVVIIASGTDAKVDDGIDIETILDGVQYRLQPYYPRTIDQKIDKSTVLTSPKYSGKSMQRRLPGMDTNNGRLDWETINAPTPGWQ